jgi:hypothetical protein
MHGTVSAPYYGASPQFVFMISLRALAGADKSRRETMFFCGPIPVHDSAGCFLTHHEPFWIYADSLHDNTFSLRVLCASSNNLFSSSTKDLTHERPWSRGAIPVAWSLLKKRHIL